MDKQESMNGTITFKYNFNGMPKKLEGLTDLALRILLVISDGKRHYFKDSAENLGVTIDEFKQSFIELKKHKVIEVESVNYRMKDVELKKEGWNCMEVVVYGYHW